MTMQSHKPAPETTLEQARQPRDLPPIYDHGLGRAPSHRPLMALFDRRHRLDLPGGYWLQKDDENRWQLGQGQMFLAAHISSNVPVGDGGSMDHAIKEFVETMNAGR